ncbi:unnamed protein product [Staurois parvus]|uniref:Uncharacterized protein n=1 Tax=Staurois parvus TaxID=386267 RepID=A0ABN9HC05_9NEOB|nr:unnamed protein product [Staurois parvus]
MLVILTVEPKGLIDCIARMFSPVFSVSNPSADRTEPWGQAAHAQFGVHC